MVLHHYSVVSLQNIFFVPVPFGESILNHINQRSKRKRLVMIKIYSKVT